MPLAITELSKAREAVAALLEALELETYLFGVEPDGEEWQVKVECAIEDGWETVTLAVEKETLLASLDDRDVRQRLLDELKARLGACKIRSA